MLLPSPESGHGILSAKCQQGPYRLNNPKEKASPLKKIQTLVNFIHLDSMRRLMLFTLNAELYRKGNFSNY